MPPRTFERTPRALGLALVMLFSVQVAAAPVAAAPVAAMAPASPSAGAAPAAEPGFFQRSDITFALVSAAAVFAAGRQDLWLTSEGMESNTHLDRGVANAARPLGDPALVLPVLLAGYGLARWSGSPERAAGFVEVGASVCAAGAAALVIKEAVGRARPADSPDDPASFRPFSGRNSFPSGHATVAFALAEGVNRASGARWAPWLTYPAAALVGWSRVRDDRHWTSDVVAGAALGVWTARKVHRLRQAGRLPFARLEIGAGAPGGAPGVIVTLR